MRNGLYGTLIFFLLPYLLFRCIRTGRYRRGLRQKIFGVRESDFLKHLQNRKSDSAPVVWLHGVSVGEVQLLVPLVRRLAAEYPGHRFVVSVTTDSGMKLARDTLSDFELFYFPFDFTWAIKKTLSVLQPKLVVMAELELWPNLCWLAQQRNVPLAVVNGRLSEKSFRGYERLGWLTRNMFQSLRVVSSQTEEYSERFRRCGCSSESVVTTGNLKFDNVGMRSDAPEVLSFRKMAGVQESDRIVMLGSSQEEEETAILSAFPAIKKQLPRARLVVIPRHPERFEKVYAACQHLAQARSLGVAKRSQLASDSIDWDILLVDTVGELKWWWGLAEVAIVGGSFGSRGGQNMLEPAAYGCNVAFGPDTVNFRDITRLLLESGGAVQLPNLRSIGTWIQSELSLPLAGVKRGQCARQFIKSQQGATDRTVAALRPLLDDPVQDKQAA